MAFLQESNRWTPTIYRIERNDPLMGGEFGINNVQAKQIASRTQYLLEYFLRFHEVDGSHKLSEASVAEDAAIPESRLALTTPTEVLHTQYSAHKEVYDRILEALNAVSSMSGTDASALYRALLLSWEYSGASYDFCLFSKLFPFCDHGFKVRLTKTVAEDDSIDIIDAESQHLLKEDESYILVYDGALPQVVTVDRILETNRVTLKEDLQVTLNPEDNAYLCQCSWLIMEFQAHVRPGGIMLTRRIDTLMEYSVGVLSIQHRKPDTQFDVQFRYDQMEPWRSATFLTCHAIADGLFSTKYSFPAGAPVYLKITSLSTDVIENMATYADVSYDKPAFVRIPKLYSPLRIERFGALYNDQFARLDVTISDNIDFGIGTQGTRTFSFTPETLPMTDPVIDLYDLINQDYGIVTGRTYYWQARYTSQRGYVSDTSKVMSFVA